MSSTRRNPNPGQTSQCSKRIVLTTLIAATLLFPGCTGLREWWHNGLKVGPNYCPPPVPVAQEWIDADDPTIQTGPMDYSCWWTVFNDPLLDQLVHRAYQENLPLRVAGMRILEARAFRGVAVGNLLPQQQAMTTEYSRTTSSGSSRFGPFVTPKAYFQRWATGFDAAWELDFWGKFRREVEAANADLQASVASYDDVLVILQAEVAATYVEIRTLQRRLFLAYRNLELQKGTLNLTEIRFQEGVASRLDVEQALTDVAVTESAIPLLETAYRQAQNKLCILLGTPPYDLEPVLGDPDKIPDDPKWIPSAPPEIVVGIPADLIRRRPDIRRAEREVAAQSARIGVAKAELYPHFSITGNIGLEAARFSQIFSLNSVTGTVAPGFRWNILNYGRILNLVRVEDARFQQSVLNCQQTVLEAAEETENAIIGYLQEVKRLDALGRGAEAAKQSFDLSTAKYKAGTIDFDRVLDSQRILVREQDRQAEGQGNTALQMIAIYKALGGGWMMRIAPRRMEVPQTEISIQEESRPADMPPLPPPPTPETPAPEAPGGIDTQDPLPPPM